MKVSNVQNVRCAVIKYSGPLVLHYKQGFADNR